MNRDEQALLTFRAVNQQGTQQRTLRKIQAALGISEQRFALVHRRDAYLPENSNVGHRLMRGLPLSIGLAEAQTQGVMLLNHRQQRLLQTMRFQRHSWLQQQRLVPVLAFRDFRVEEPMLNRRQGRFASHQALLGRHLLGTTGYSGQSLYGLMLEQITRAEMNTLLTRTADHLNRQNRIAAEFEEVVVEADLFDVEHLAPDLRQGLLQFVTRRDVVLTIQLRIRRRQGAAVEFAVGGQRHARQQNQVGRHHVIRQLCLEVRLEGVAQFSLTGFTLLSNFGDQIANQLFAARGIQCEHHGFTDRIVIKQTRFDFAQFDTESTDFHLMVDSSQIFHQTIGTLAHQVTGAIHAPAIGGERVSDKTLGGNARTVVIRLRQTGPTDEQLTGRTLRYQCQIGVENVRDTRANHAANRHAAGALVQHLRRQTGQRHDHGFGRAVSVEEHRRFERRANPLQVFTGQRFAAGNDHPHRQDFVLR
ncbi:hypothetical protein D3C87_1038930 [compost metagenome]